MADDDVDKGTVKEAVRAGIVRLTLPEIAEVLWDTLDSDQIERLVEELELADDTEDEADI